MLTAVPPWLSMTVRRGAKGGGSCRSMTSKSDILRLAQTHSSILELRAIERARLLQHLRVLRDPCQRVAARFQRRDMSFLIAGFTDLEWAFLSAIDVSKANVNGSDDGSFGAFSHVLASQLASACDFPLSPRFCALQEADMSERGETSSVFYDFIDRLATTVRRLSADEAVALFLILECARAIPAAHNNYIECSWWHPAFLEHLLENPNDDSPAHEKPLFTWVLRRRTQRSTEAE